MANALKIILTILPFLTFIGIPQIWASNWKEVFNHIINGILPWRRIFKSIRVIKKQIDRIQFEPTIIIGIGRGGLISAGLILSEITNQKLKESKERNERILQTPNIRVEHMLTLTKLKTFDEISATRNKRHNISENIESQKVLDNGLSAQRGDKVLLIIAQSYQGTSLSQGLEILIKKGIPRENIKTATLFLFEVKGIPTVHDPDIIGAIVKNTRMTMPWKNPYLNTDRY